MTNAELAKRQERATAEKNEIVQIEGGYRVHAPADPTKFYLVTSEGGVPHCTCLDFQFHGNDPEWRCKHILAVASRLPAASSATESADPTRPEERRAIPAESREPPRRNSTPTPTPVNGAAQMVVKRCLSLDGRNDSLSIEFSCPINALTAPEVEARVKELLSLQPSIADVIKAQRKRRELPDPPPTPEGKSAVALGRILGIGGKDGKWGRRLFITVQTNGHNLRHYGSRQQLAEFITAAGFPQMAQNIAEGVKLDLPCRIITEPSADGNYVHITQVLPAEGNGGCGPSK